jgi:hypothetical protein
MQVMKLRFSGRKMVRVSNCAPAAFSFAFAFDGHKLMLKIRSSFERIKDIETTSGEERLSYGNN